jgi:adenosylhomocysteine nucleosidase
MRERLAMMRPLRHRDEPYILQERDKGSALTDQAATDVSEVSAMRADIGLVCALPMELGDFLGRCSKVKTYTGGSFTFRGGIYRGIRIAMVESGPGPVRARRATVALLDAHAPRWIISTGFCGALVPNMQVGQIVVANKIRTVADDELAVDIGMTSDAARGLYVGRTLTVEQMVRTIAQKQALAESTGAIAVDMETHAIASLCRERKTRFLAVRAISDDMSTDLPDEVLSLVGETGAVRIGAVIGALWKRPGSYKDLWRLREQAMVAGERLAEFLDGVVKQLYASP